MNENNMCDVSVQNIYGKKSVVLSDNDCRKIVGVGLATTVLVGETMIM